MAGCVPAARGLAYCVRAAVEERVAVCLAAYMIRAIDVAGCMSAESHWLLAGWTGSAATGGLDSYTVRVHAFGFNGSANGLNTVMYMHLGVCMHEKLPPG